ncbi:MAG: hypothetical protein K2X27_20540 [Candidatus Obscuribacterales bacterium]|nr:hypothetical protein [Candidatus Obscuribacterales bacterium]
MIRALTATLTVLCLAGITGLPAFADESTDAASSSSVAANESSSDTDKKAIAENKKDSDDSKDSKKESKKDDGDKKKSASKTDLATRLASFTTGVVFGTPIAIVRRTGMEIAQGERDLIGEADTWYKKVAMVFPGFIAVPYGAVSGGVGGCVYSVKNAWTGSGDAPFGKESFSLGDIGN